MPRGLCLVTAVICLLLAPLAWGQRASSWRTFRASDGLRETRTIGITMNPKGIVLANHSPDVESFSRLDGDKTETFPYPGGHGKVYESRTAQLWTSSRAGLMVYRDKEWISFPISPIQEAFGRSSADQ